MIGTAREALRESGLLCSGTSFSFLLHLLDNYKHTRPVPVIPVSKHSSPQSTLYCYTSTLHYTDCRALLYFCSTVQSSYCTVQYVTPTLCSMFDEQDINGHIEYCVGFNVQWGRRRQRIERTGLDSSRSFQRAVLVTSVSPVVHALSYLEI